MGYEWKIERTVDDQPVMARFTFVDVEVSENGSRECYDFINVVLDYYTVDKTFCHEESDDEVALQARDPYALTTNWANSYDCYYAMGGLPKNETYDDYVMSASCISIQLLTDGIHNKKGFTVEWCVGVNC